jgi:putative Mg2+ transporter-C (MgtC) family protein
MGIAWAADAGMNQIALAGLIFAVVIVSIVWPMKRHLPGSHYHKYNW